MTSQNPQEQNLENSSENQFAVTPAPQQAKKNPVHVPLSCKSTSKAQAVSLLYKTQICKHFMQTGHCAKGDACHFAHGDNELRRKEDMHSLPAEMQFKLLNIPYNNFKTQRCKYFEQEGMCRFGKNCSYAHGMVDLRKPYEDLPEETVKKVTQDLADQNAVLLAVNSAQQQTGYKRDPFQPTAHTPVQFVPAQYARNQQYAASTAKMQQPGSIRNMPAYGNQQQMMGGFTPQQQHAPYMQSNLSAFDVQQMQAQMMMQQQQILMMQQMQLQQSLQQNSQGSYGSTPHGQLSSLQNGSAPFQPQPQMQQWEVPLQPQDEEQAPCLQFTASSSTSNGGSMYTAIPGEKSVADQAAWW